MANAKEILEKWLEDNGYDGLCWPGECACKVGEVMVCGESCADCVPGHFIPRTDPDFDRDYDYMIRPEKTS